MFHKLIPGRAFAALAVGGTLALTQLVGPTSTVTGSPDITRVAEYPAHYVFEGRRVSQVCYALRREDWG